MNLCGKDHFQSIKHKFIATIQQIKEQYGSEMDKLRDSMSQKDKQISKLNTQLKKKQQQVDQLVNQNMILHQNILKHQHQHITLSQTNTTLSQTITKLNNKMNQNNNQLQQLNLILKDKQEQIHMLKKQQLMSIDQSTVSFRDSSQSFSIQISQLFKHQPQEIHKFLESIKGEYPKKESQEGDMTCMFVSRDGLSLDKYQNINRSFLKRAIKENQKRFRFVLIHKPEHK